MLFLPFQRPFGARPEDQVGVYEQSNKQSGLDQAMAQDIVLDPTLGPQCNGSVSPPFTIR